MNEKLNIVNKKLSDFSIYNNGTWQSEKEIITSYCPDLGIGCPWHGYADGAEVQFSLVDGTSLTMNHGLRIIVNKLSRITENKDFSDSVRCIRRRRK